LALVDNAARSHRLRLVDETTLTKRAKPEGVEGAEVYSFVAADGQAPPADLTQWRFEGQTRRWDYTVSYDAADVGKTAYLKALWFNPRGQCGPESEPIAATVAA
jgi:hypothetical protein